MLSVFVVIIDSCSRIIHLSEPAKQSLGSEAIGKPVENYLQNHEEVYAGVCQLSAGGASKLMPSVWAAKETTFGIQVAVEKWEFSKESRYLAIIGAVEKVGSRHPCLAQDSINLAYPVVFIKDQGSSYYMMNDGFRSALGLTEDLVDHQIASTFLRPDLRVSLSSHDIQVASGLEHVSLVELTPGTIYELHKISISVKEGLFILGVAWPTSNPTSIRHRLDGLGRHDPISGLLNRPQAERQLVTWVGQKDFWVFLIDIDKFQTLNRVLGCHTGTRVLQVMGQVLLSTAPVGSLVARWGNDEFLMCIPAESCKVKQIEQEIINKVRHANLRDSVPFTVTVGHSFCTGFRPVHEVLGEAEEMTERRKLLTSNSSKHSSLLAMQTMLKEKCGSTQSHVRRTRLLCRKLGEQLGLSDSVLDQLDLLALLHDIGKISVPDSILKKPAKLNEQEWALIKEHPVVGYKILMLFPELTPVARGVLYHHEWWDGSGYPHGLRNEEIPLISRVVSVVDAYDVMSGGRAYKRPMTEEEIRDEFLAFSAKQFDPTVVKCFLGLRSQSA